MGVRGRGKNRLWMQKYVKSKVKGFAMDAVPDHVWSIARGMEVTLGNWPGHIVTHGILQTSSHRSSANPGLGYDFQINYNLRCPCGTNKQRQAPEVMTLVKMDWGVVGGAGGEVDSVYLD